MPKSFVLYVLLSVGAMIVLITANRWLGPQEYHSSDWVDRVRLFYFGMASLSVVWWGLMWRDDVAFAGYIVQTIIGTIMVMMITPYDATYYYDIDIEPLLPMSLADYAADAVIVTMLCAIMFAIIFLVLFAIGAVLRYIAELIVSVGNREVHAQGH